ncbi:MAG: carotenoid biosynthesis protein [Spirochaetales bacterium]|nr:carotenoid biosynthesis protein [Spirochaetales bacterium]
MTQLRLKNPVHALSLILIILYTVGTAGHLIPQTLPLMLILTPWFLYATGFAVALAFLLPDLMSGGRSVLVWTLGVLGVTFFLESLGTHTGLIFGEYTYGQTLGIHAVGVPPVIALNWVLVMCGIIYITERVIKNPILMAAVSGLLAVLYDYILEPTAIRLDYWTWAGGTIPLQNYIAWGLIAFTAALFWPLVKKRMHVLPAVLVGIQFIFFTILLIFL